MEARCTPTGATNAKVGMNNNTHESMETVRSQAASHQSAALTCLLPQAPLTAAAAAQTSTLTLPHTPTPAVAPQPCTLLRLSRRDASANNRHAIPELLHAREACGVAVAAGTQVLCRGGGGSEVGFRQDGKRGEEMRVRLAASVRA